MEGQLQVEMDEFLPLRDVVFNTLRKAILTGQLRPGERLMEVHLANRLGVSRTPIREAIRKLEEQFAGEGRVLIRPSGTEPLVRVMIEGKDRQVIQREAEKLANLIQDVMF